MKLDYKALFYLLLTLVVSALVFYYSSQETTLKEFFSFILFSVWIIAVGVAISVISNWLKPKN